MLPHERTRFAHNSERQFAKLLDFYGIVWEYEPRTFILEWDREGNPQQAFSPDFYLPAYELYIEITTLNQKLVTKKNGKVRRLRELHPDVKVKVFYQRDYLALLLIMAAFGGIVAGLMARAEVPIGFFILVLAGVLAGQMTYRWRQDLLLTTVVTVAIAFALAQSGCRGCEGTGKDERARALTVGGPVDDGVEPLPLRFD